MAGVSLDAAGARRRGARAAFGLGILSHCAVVAREYRIPAVVGTGVATKMIRDGQVIEVDGDNGTVRIVG